MMNHPIQLGILGALNTSFAYLIFYGIGETNLLMIITLYDVTYAGCIFWRSLNY